MINSSSWIIHTTPINKEKKKEGNDEKTITIIKIPKKYHHLCWQKNGRIIKRKTAIWRWVCALVRTKYFVFVLFWQLKGMVWKSSFLWTSIKSFYSYVFCNSLHTRLRAKHFSLVHILHSAKCIANFWLIHITVLSVGTCHCLKNSLLWTTNKAFYSFALRNSLLTGLRAERLLAIYIWHSVESC